MARHGENIHKRKDGRWEARIIISRDQNGKAVYRSVYGNTYDEVKEKKSVFVQSGNRFIQSDLTFDEAAEQWLNSKKGKVKSSTYNHYRNQYTLHIKHVFEDKKLTDLKEDDYDNFLLQLEEDSYSSRTITLLRTIIKMILKYAESKFSIPSHQDIYIPKKPSRHVEAFTRSEQALIDTYFADHLDYYALAVMFSLYCGLRIGEVCALQWKDINMKTGVITVSKTLIRLQTNNDVSQSKTQVIIDKPKTVSSIRRIPIPAQMIRVLNEHYSDFSPEHFVITGTIQYMEPRVCLRKFKKIIRSLGIEDYSFHACRHTYATRCIELGIDPKILSELLGHSSVKTTLDRYVHPSMDFKKEQVNRLISLNDHK